MAAMLSPSAPPAGVDALARSREPTYHRAIESFLYLHCNDVAEARDFYTDSLGLPEIYYSAHESSVGYRVGSLQLTITEHSEVPPADGWSSQLGWRGGSSAFPSWGFQLDPDGFRQAVARLRDRRTEAHIDDPEWVGYWSYRVKDPMGNTVEVSCSDEGAWAAD